jgi:DNA-binding SARP family transcriptional activator
MPGAVEDDGLASGRGRPDVVLDVRIALLGGFDVVVAGSAVPRAEWRRRQAANLIKLLALTPGRALHREQVADSLWPDLDVDAAAPRLHKAAHYARRSLGSPRSIVLGGETVALFPDDRVEVDAAVFQSLGEAALAARDPASAGRAADAYPGDLLPQDPYESWAEQPRDRLRLLQFDLLRLAGRWEALAVADPTDEQAHLIVARQLADSGQRQAALRQLERLERALRSELGVAPAAETLRLRAELLAAAEPGPAAAPPRRMELVGREAELDRVRRLLTATREGSGRVLFVAGPAGVGKTSMVATVEEFAAGAGMRVGSGAAARIDGAWPFAPVLEALADLCRRHPTLLDGLEDAFRDEIERALTGRDSRWDGLGTHQRLFVAVAELVRLAAAGSGAVLVVDDAHEADEGSLRLLHFLARSTVTEPVLLVLSHRPTAGGVLGEVRGALLGRGAAITMDLGPLAAADAATLARRYVPDAADDALDGLYEASGGLPFTVVEMARSAAADGAPAGAAALPEDMRTALSVVAVLGSVFDTDEFTALAGLPDEAAYAQLDLAIGLGLLRRRDVGYEFRHPLLRSSLLDATGPNGLRAAHRRAAAALAELGRSPARIGRHLVLAGDTAAAVPWVLRAAETEAALGAYQDALATLQPIETQVTGEDRERLLALRADLLSVCGDAGALAAHREALAAASGPAAQARQRVQLARAATVTGDLDTAEAALSGLTVDAVEDPVALLLARGALAFHRSDFAAADEAASEARRRLALAGTADWRWFDLIALQGWLAHHRGEWFQRLRAELRAGLLRPDLAIGIFDSHLCVAEYLLYGPTPYREVLDLAGELRRTAQRAGALRAVAFATALRGEAALLSGDVDLAESELQEAADLHHELGSPAGEAHSLQRLAEVHLVRGDRETATRLLHRALPLARWSMIGDHLMHRVYGCMIEAAADLASARAMVDRAEATLGVEDRCVFCSIMLSVPAARVCADIGDLEDARRHLRMAEASEALWEGTAWQASVLEARAHLARAERRDAEAGRLVAEAATLFDAAGHARDAARCRSWTGVPVNTR